MKISVTLFVCLWASHSIAAPADRVAQPVDSRQTTVVEGNLHRLAQPRFDQGPVDGGMAMSTLMIFLKPSAAQQADLEKLLDDLQNPSSSRFRKWLTPEAFGDRFGVSASDRSKVVAWLASSGFTIEHLSRAMNWIAFRGTAAQVETALHTPIHRFLVNGETHFANIDEPSVPSALAGVIGGFLGLNDFRWKPFAIPVKPDFNSGGSHYLAPADFATIYDINPLYQAGIDGTGQSIAIAGGSDILLSDISAFRARYGLPANTPVLVPYGEDPGFNGYQFEANLDLEWAGAVAPSATLVYVYGADIFESLIIAIEGNFAPVVSISAGGCEAYYPPIFYRAVAQQGNAQGITILASSGDSGAAGCDPQAYQPLAERGPSVIVPAALPEVTGVGGTEFVEGSGTYWGPTNSSTFGSALSYIPEQAWNESSISAGLLSGGGGESAIYSQPAWQAGPGVPSDGARHVPDISFSAALHDAYEVIYWGSNLGTGGGTSAAAQVTAGIVALLNHYQVANGFQNLPGLGNINPQLYRLAQSAPSVFHDIVAGNNVVPCAQASPGCLTGSFGYQAGPGYDLATGLGSMDVNALATQWNTAAQGVVVRLSANPSSGTLNDTIQVTATVKPAGGNGTPTGTVNFAFDGLALGSAPLANGSASLALPLYLLGGVGTASISAEYSGDATFSAGGASTRVRVTATTTAAAVLLSAPDTVWADPPDAAGLSWPTSITLREIGGSVAAMLTGFTIDGQQQNLSQYFPSPDIPPGGSVSALIISRNLTVPATRTFLFTGVDADGNTWSRQASVVYLPLPVGEGSFNLAATPLVVAQNPSADPSCQWSTQLNADDAGGVGGFLLNGLFAGGVDLTEQIPSIFGTERLTAWGELQGTLCFSGITPPASNVISLTRDDGSSEQLTVSFVGPPANPITLSASPASVVINNPNSGRIAVQTTLAVNLSDKNQSWTASIYPANTTTAWLNASPLSGIGSGQIGLTVPGGTPFEPGVYRATIVLESANAVPQVINVPVMMVLGGSSTTSIGGTVLYGSNISAASPGTLLSFYGSNLANSTASASGNPLPFTLAGVSATVNNLAAPMLFVSPNVVNIQVPYEAGAGPAVLGINNNGAIAGFQFPLAPSSPAILADQNGDLIPSANVTRGQGKGTTLYVVGVGDVSPALETGFSPVASMTASSLPLPLLPVSVTVGGVPAFVTFAGITPGFIGLAQVNITLPESTPTGSQPLVVAVGGVSSPSVNVVVQ
jgi:uncharacterized protein (TIGR03437 family)